MSAAVAVFGIALLAALLYAVLEKQAPAYALLLSLGAALVLLVRAGTSIRTVLSGIARLPCTECGYRSADRLYPHPM